MAGEETDAYEGREGTETLTEYEKQRLARIRENEARLEALGLRGLAASPLLRNPSPAAAAAARRKQKKQSANEDDEYLPSYESGGEEESSSESGQDDEMDGESKSSSRSNAKGKKKKLLNSGKASKNTTMKGGPSFADFVDDDAALQQAIALSLVGSSERSMTTMGAETSGAGVEGSGGTPHKKNSKASVQDSAKHRKIKKLGKSRIQLTEDDVVAFFFSIDEVGKGYITPWDLERMATINDFIWTDSEISNMIRCFDSDGDGKINLEDFRSILSRCNMLQEPEKQG